MDVHPLTAFNDALLGEDLDLLDDGSLHRLVVDLERETTRLTAARARVVAQWDTRRAWADDGSKAPSGRLARECRMSLAQARAELRRARA